MPLFVHRSNRTEALVDALAALVAEPLASVFASEHVVVQGAGMERWLTGQLAARFGVWAAPSFPFPRAAAELVLEAFLGPPPAEGALFGVETMTLRIAAALPALLDDAAFAALRAYLARDSHGARILPVATELARCFDRYAVYRPELLLAFERGEGDPLQSRLWRAIGAGAQHAHFAARLHALEQRTHLPPRAPLPERLSLFGLSALAPALLHVFRAAAAHIPVHAFLLVPVRDYYDDFDRSTRHRRDVGGLVGRFGRMIRELDHDLGELDGVDAVVSDVCVAPAEQHALARLQAALLTLEDAPVERHPVALDDDSLRVHVCTSKVRELQVLRDELLMRFERSPALAPKDVVVLVPDITVYTQAIDAVFGDGDEALAIPYRVADVAAARDSQAAGALLQFVAAVHGRFTLSELLDLLHTAKLRACFALEDDDLAHFEAWLESAGARHGLGGQRVDLHSLGFALDRLLLGSVLPDTALGAYADVVPKPSVEGKASASLGKLARIVRSMEELLSALAVPASIATHAQGLVKALDALFDGTRGDDPIAVRVKHVLGRMAADSTSARATSPVDVRSVANFLAEQLENGGTSSAFLAGAVTFCQHVPMRAIPFRVVYMLGMDETSFPRRVRQSTFDLATERPRRGDRNPRDDDRQLFLDAFLSARDALVISYVSEAPGTHDAQGPSAVIGHLLRAAESHLAFPRPGHEHVIRTHPRLAFDARYFDPRPDAAFRSFDARALRLARTWLGAKSEAPMFAPSPLTTRPREGALELAELLQFFKHPQRTFFQRRLGVRMWEDREASADREPVLVLGLERYDLGERMLRELARLSPSARAELLARSGELPKGMLGQVQLRELEFTAEALRAAIELGDAVPAREFELTLDADTVLVGQLDGMRALGRQQVVFGTLTVKRRLGAWIEHLVLCLLERERARSVLVGRDKDTAKVVQFGPVSEPENTLRELVALLRLGQNEPLPFWPDASLAYTRARLSGKSDEEAFASAARNVSGGHFQQSDAAARDPYLARAFGDLNASVLANMHTRDAAALSFGAIAERVFRPLLAAEREGDDA